jgi:long-chain acyl-CoA synthetase
MTTNPPDSLPLDWLYRWEKERPDALYMTQPMGGGALHTWTWGQAIDEARRMATYLQSLGYEPGTRIGIISKNCAWWIMSDWAIWLAGYISVPLYPTLTAASVRQILEHSECKACFIGKLDDWPAMKPGVPDGVHCISYPLSPPNDYESWDDIVAKTAPLQGQPQRDAKELFTIIYTSGTTGMPKGVMHNFSAFAWALRAGNTRFDLKPEDRQLSYLPLSHIAERVATEMGSLHSGCQLFFAESLDTFVADLQRARPTLFFSVPRLWVKFQQGVLAKVPAKKLDRLLKIPLLGRLVRKKILAGLGLDQCRFAAGGAAPMPPTVLDWYQRLGLEIIEVYGMTENCAVCHSNVPGDTKPGYVGMPYPGVEQRIGPVTGEVQMRSPGMMMGYYKEPEKTREVLTEDGWLKTGDKGELDEKGRLRITGRVKDLFKTSKGKYVAPAPIEDRLVVHSRVEACCVTGASQPQPCALVMLSPDAKADGREALTASLQSHLEQVNGQLDDHEKLAFLVVVSEAWTVEAGFVTPTMKVKRNMIEDTYGPQLDAWYAKNQAVVWQ